jgi:hypothetical protein
MNAVGTPLDKFQRRLRLLPLYATLRVARVLAWAIPGSREWHPTRPGPWQPGVSVLVPERGTPDLLGETLAAACRGNAACLGIDRDHRAGQRRAEYELHGSRLAVANRALGIPLRSARVQRCDRSRTAARYIRLGVSVEQRHAPGGRRDCVPVALSCPDGIRAHLTDLLDRPCAATRGNRLVRFQNFRP